MRFLPYFLLSLFLASLLAEEPPELKFTKWSGEVNVPDPVAISLDDQGRAYVTQTQRRKSQDLDIRQNRDWIENDVSFQSVEDKRAFYQDRLAPENSDQNKERVGDLNQDGSHDYRDLMVKSEKIHRLTDTDGDGKADQIELFADGFQTEVTGIAAGVLWHEGDVYSTIAPDVWRLRDTDGDGEIDKREVMATGFGVHIAYAGHDMHGLTVGPDGKIYWSIGDKGISVTTKEGETFLYPNQGGVLRCNPDGSDFEVFAHGLRNVQELAFDEYGNLFGVDNDADQPNEKERFVYIVQSMDAGWRCNYQYRGSGYNPWTAEKLWQPRQEGQPAYFLPPIVNYEDGPAGFVYNPGTALSPEWQGWFFMTEAPRGNQWAFQVEPDGASFQMKNSRQIGTGIPLVGLNWGPDGALYSVDWGGGYPLNQKGAVWKIDVPGAEESEQRQEVRKLMALDYGEASDEELSTLLSHPDQRIRLKAQFELVEREAEDILSRAALTAPKLGRIHGIWGLDQLARREDRDAVSALAALEGFLGDPEPEIRSQVLKMFASLDPSKVALSLEAQEQVIALLADENPRVRFFAALAAGGMKLEEAEPSLVALLERNNGSDLYLRHAGITGLAGLGAGAALTDHPSEEVRLAAVVALRRNADPAVAKYLSDPSEAVVTEAALAIHDDFSIPEALPDLAAILNTTPFRNEKLIRRAINANFRLGELHNAVAMVEFGASVEVARDLRLEVLDALTTWPAPANLDRVDGRYRKLDARNPEPLSSPGKLDLGPYLASSDDTIVEHALEVASALGIILPEESLTTLLENDSVSGPLRAQALKNLGTPEAMDYALKSKDATLRIRASEILAKQDPQRAVSYLKTRLAKGSLQEQQTALALLAKLESPEADAVIGAEAAAILDRPAGLHLDILESASARGIDQAATAYQSLRDPAVLTSQFLECLEGGDPKAGKEVVMTHLAAQCIRCHKIEDGKGSIIGPNLKDAGSKERLYLLESLIDPGKAISEGYGTVALTLKDGTVVTGQFRKETDKIIELRDAMGKSTKVPTEDIQDRTPALSVMPPMGALLKKQELRDVVAYLATLKTKKK